MIQIFTTHSDYRGTTVVSRSNDGGGSIMQGGKIVVPRPSQLQLWEDVLAEFLQFYFLR